MNLLKGLKIIYFLVMSEVKLAVKVFRDLEIEDFKILLALEKGMKRYQYVPSESIPFLSNISPKEVEFRLGRLSEMRLIRRWVGSYVGYALNRAGYDCLALNALVKNDVLEAVGLPLGVGKESNVYEGLTPEKERVAIKFHRLGSISFRNVKKLRGYVKRDERVSWLSLARIAAEREYKALRILYPLKISVPKPIARNRHVIVMSIIEGTELENLLEIPDSERIFKDVLRNIRKAYEKAKIIHADLSGFNILIKPEGEILIIDWPQYVTVNHPNADLLLKRDIRNVLTLFRRKANLEADLEKTVQYVKGHVKSLDL